MERRERGRETERRERKEDKGIRGEIERRRGGR